MIFYLTGPKKFLVAGCMFALFGCMMFYSLVIQRHGEHPFSLALASLIVVLMGIILLWIWADMKKFHLTAGASDIPDKYRFLVFGYLFTSTGISLILIPLSFGFNPPGIAGHIALWVSILIFFVPGIISLVVFFRHRRSRKNKQEIEKKEQNIGTMIGGGVAAATIYGMLIAFGAVGAGKIGLGMPETVSILVLVTILFAVLCVKIYHALHR